MTASYHLIFPMPAGRTTSGNGKLSVFFVPRLQADGPLTDWDGDWRNWPKVVTGSNVAPPLSLQVALANGGAPTVVPTNDNITVGSPRWLTPAPSSAAWDATFGTASATPIQVERFRPRLRTDPDALAPMFNAPRLARAARAVHEAMAGGFELEPPTTEEIKATTEYAALLATGDMADHKSHMAPLGDGDITNENTPADADFHAALAFLQSHPELLRTLGLVVDLEVAVPAGQVSVSVGSNFEAAHVPAKAVPMVVDCDADFWPITGPGGWAPIGDGSHDVTSIDIGVATSTLDSVSPAPLRTTALQVVRSGDDLRDELNARWLAQTELEDAIVSHLRTGTPAIVPVDGDELTVGRRYDVYDETVGRWFSIWDRDAPDGFEFPRRPDLNIVPEPDEGWMTYTGMTEHPVELDDPVGVDIDPDPRPSLELNRFPKITPAPHRIDSTPLRISPILIGWNGWSLAAHQPGRAFSGVDGPIDRAPNEPTDEMALKVGVSYRVPDRVLPRLRYTRRYKFRARLVDYAGNSRELSEAHPGGDTETELVTYGRTSPLRAPTVVRRTPRTAPGYGDTPLTLVIRSELAQGDSSVAPTTRLLFPPTTTQFQCELHGAPAPGGLFRDPATFDDVVARTAASIETHAAADPTTGELVSEPVGVWRPAVTYLVEPAVAGFAFGGVPGVPEASVVTVPVDASWPQSHAVGIEMRAGGGAPALPPPSPGAPALVVEVPKGVTRGGFVSTQPKPELIDHWSLVPSLSPETRQVVLAGQHWMVSARQAMTFVHAVRQPLEIPAHVDVPTIGREIGRTDASMGGTFALDVKSTGSVEVQARWTDPVDTPGAPGGVSDVTATRVLFTQSENYDETSSVPIDSGAFELGDTKRHDAVIKLTAVSRYARHFTEATTIRFPTATSTVEVAPEGIADLNVQVRSDGVGFRNGNDFTIDSVGGTITRTAPSAIPVGADVTVDFIRLPITRRSDEDGTPPQPLLIPNSGVPAAVPIVEVVPAFARTRFDDGERVGVQHDGATVRVWIERPWFTTGAGELLGVVVGTSAGGPLSAVARDPLSPTGPTAPLRLLDFPESVVSRQAVGASNVHVAGHAVEFDEQRQQWFADIVIGGDIGYRPFVRLALVRFQPESVDGAHISDVVSTGPVRLGATRSAHVQLVGGGVEVVVEGLELGNEVTAHYQFADPDVADPDLAWTNLDEPVVLTASTGTAETTWSTTLPAPASPHPVRVVIEDAELLTHQFPTGPATVRNVSYIDTIPLPGAWSAVAPGAPADVTAVGLDGAVDVSWAVGDDGGTPVTTSEVEWRTVGGTVLGTVDVDGTATAALVGGLTNGTAYEFRVRLENAIGFGPWSAAAVATPMAAVPGPVADLVARGGHTAAMVEWAAPADDGGSPLTGYRVEHRVGAGPWGTAVDLSITRTRHIERSLTNGTAYTFRVRADSGVGPGPWTETAPIVPDVMTPARVTSVRASSGASVVRLRWRSVSPRGAPLTGYRIEQRVPGGTWTLAAMVGGDANAVTVGPLPSATTVRFRIRGESAVGAGAWSGPLAITVNAGGTRPAQVRGLGLSPADGALLATWEAADDGGSALTSYEVEARSADDATVSRSTVGPDELVASIDGLTNGVIHTCRVRAVNVVGRGAWSATVDGVPTP